MAKNYELIEDKDGFKLRLHQNHEIVIYGAHISELGKHWLVYGCYFPRIKGNNARVVGLAHSKKEGMRKAYEHIRIECVEYDFADNTSRAEESALAEEVAKNPLIQDRHQGLRAI